MHILVVDDEHEIADLITVILEKEGFTVSCFYDSVAALQSLDTQEYDIALLDVMMPQVDGFTLCEFIRRRFRWPVIMLTARVEDEDKIYGLSAGADDYVTKPFNPLELLARVKAQLRRYTCYDRAERADIYDMGGLVINAAEHTCTLYEQDVLLTPREFAILWLLCQNAGSVVSAKDIYETVWNEKYLDSSNSVMVHIRRLREKLHEPSRAPKFIKTVWGVGYRIEREIR